MRLREVQAHGFGTLVGEQLEFGPGVTVVCGPNESGKSTWHAAVATGLTGRRKGRQTKADREVAERHTPWSGDVFAVSAVVDVAGSLLRVHRDLAAGVDSVYDEHTGQDVTSQFVVDGACDLSRLVGLDRRTLPLAALVRQGEVLAVTQAEGDDADALRSFLQQAAASRSDSDVTAELAITRLDKFVKDALGSERRNSSKPLRTAIDAAAAARDRLDHAREAQSSGDRLRGQIDTADHQLFVMRAQIQRGELAAAQGAQAATQAELAEAERLAAQLTPPGHDEVSDPESTSANEHRVDTQALRRLAWELDQPVPQPEPTTAEREHFAAAQIARAEQTERSLLAAAALGALLVVVSVLASAQSWLDALGAVALAVVGIAVLALAAMASHRQRQIRVRSIGQQAELRDQRTRADAVRDEHQGRHRAAVAEARQLGFAADPAVLIAAADRADDETRQRAAVQREAQAASGRLNSLLRGRTLGELREEVASRSSFVAELTSVTAANGGAAKTPLPTPQELAELRRSIDQVAGDRERLLGQLAAATATAGDLSLLAEDYERAVVERDRLLRLRDLTARTKTYLEQARLEVHREIAPRLAQVTEERLAKVTAGRYKEMRVDPQDLSVRVRTDTGAWRSAGSLSRGTQEQIYLLLRAAIAELVAPEHESCPLILDEVTVHADDERLRALLDVVDQLADTRQVIVFTQEDRVTKWASAAGHHIVALERP